MSDYHILSLGAGVQSTALYLMFKEGILTPQIDAAIFADTQEEPSSVYEHLNWLQSLNGPPIIIRSAGKLGDDLASGRRCASIPVFTTADGGKTVGVTRRQCSKEYKTQVVERSIRRDILGMQPRQRIAKDVIVYEHIGMSFDEMGRASRVKKIFAEHSKHFVPVFDLIDRFMTRANCLDWLASRVPHQTPRSACSFCPYHTDHEWDRMKREDPEAWTRSVEIDAMLRTPGATVNRQMDQKMYLHRSCKPLDLVQLNPTKDPRASQTTMNFAAECMGMCGV